MLNTYYRFQTNTLRFLLSYAGKDSYAYFARLLKSKGIGCSEDTIRESWMEGNISTENVDKLANAFHIPLPFWYNPMISQHISQDSIVEKHWKDNKTDVTSFVKNFYFLNNANLKRTYQKLGMRPDTLKAFLFGSSDDKMPRIEYNRFIGWFEMTNDAFSDYSHNENLIIAYKCTDNEPDKVPTRLAEEEDYSHYSKHALLQKIERQKMEINELYESNKRLRQSDREKSMKISQMKVEMSKKDKLITQLRNQRRKNEG